MQQPTSHDHNLASQAPAHVQVHGAWLSITGLVAWLAAMSLAVAGPLLGIQVPAGLIVGIVVASCIFSLLSLPRLLRADEDNTHG
jgi:hypothetical protein